MPVEKRLRLQRQLNVNFTQLNPFRPFFTFRGWQSICEELSVFWQQLVQHLLQKNTQSFGAFR
jgi:hypothetical protein